MPAKQSTFAGLTKDTFLLAFTSFFSDISTEMLYPVLPIFLTQTLGVSTSIVGLIEGIAPAIQNIVQGFSGSLADKWKKRKLLATVGYAISALSKPFIGFSTSWTGVLAARSIDRLGTGTRSAPRDALIAASADEAHRGKAFGLEGIGDNLGAFVGPLVAIVLLSFFHASLRSIFWLAIIPGSLAVVMILFVRERRAPEGVVKVDLTLRKFPRKYWLYLGVTALFGIGNSTNAFLILRTQNLGVPLTITILIYAFYNFVAAAASYPAGHLSDVLGRKGVLLLAFLLAAIVYAGFGFLTNITVVGLLFILYGAYQGIFRAVGKALAIDLVPSSMRASGVGWYTATIGITGLIASLVGGQLWAMFGPQATFLYGMIFALLGSIALVALVPRHTFAGKKT